MHKLISQLDTTNDESSINHLNDLKPSDANTLQFAWIKHVEDTNNYSNFYISDNKGQLWLVGPDAQGKSITAVPIITQYVYGDEVAIYTGEDAWDDLYSDLDYKFNEVKISKKEQFENLFTVMQILGMYCSKI